MDVPSLKILDKVAIVVGEAQEALHFFQVTEWFPLQHRSHCLKVWPHDAFFYYSSQLNY